MTSLMHSALLFVILLPSSLMASNESPFYKVVSAEGPYEIRDFPELTLVSTPMQKRGSDGSFMRLFGFISGQNATGEKIAMTTPVLMTGPESGVISFIVPKDVAARGAPAPSNRDVSLTILPPARYAVHRFSGSAKPTRSMAAAQRLLDWAVSRHVETEGALLFAYYNPPWTPWFMRRNEVLVKLAPRR